MKIQIQIEGTFFTADLSKAIDLSIPYAHKKGVKAWHVEDFSVNPVVSGDFIGSIKKGAPVNFMNVQFNLHGNGTHTECLAHISDEDTDIHTVLKHSFFKAILISVTPEIANSNHSNCQAGDLIITKKQIESLCDFSLNPNAIIVRTLPNGKEKMIHDYSGTNPPYFLSETIAYLTENGIDHILCDLPSVDREQDGGKVQSHHVFWNYPEKPALHRTITELIYVPNEVKDGQYLLNLQIAPFKLDATPSRPLIFRLKTE